jgi:lysozyme
MSIDRITIDHRSGARRAASALSPSDDGLRFLKAREGFATGVYADVADKETVGYGHRLRPGESFADGVTHDEAEAIFLVDVDRAVGAVRRLVRAALTQPQFDALVSLVYNVGEGAFARSALLRKLNDGDCEGAASEFLDWDRVTVAGVRMASWGLARRRACERALFLTGQYEETADA